MTEKLIKTTAGIVEMISQLINIPILDENGEETGETINLITQEEAIALLNSDDNSSKII